MTCRAAAVRPLAEVAWKMPASAIRVARKEHICIGDGAGYRKFAIGHADIQPGEPYLEYEGIDPFHPSRVCMACALAFYALKPYTAPVLTRLTEAEGHARLTPSAECQSPAAPTNAHQEVKPATR